MAGDNGEQARYRDVLNHPLAMRLWLAATFSFFGDFIGLGALLLVAYDRSGGQALGPAAVFAVQALPAVAVATAIGPWLDRIPRIAGLISLCLIGAASLALPFAFGGLWPVLTAAAILGASTTAFNSIRSGAIAEGVPRHVRGRLLALMSLSLQLSDVIGYFAGSTVAIVIGSRPALAADAVTFVVAALLLAGCRLPSPTGTRRRSSLTTGIRTIFGNPALRALAPVAWAGLTVGALPATLATAALTGSYRGWVPAAMAAAGAGLAISGTLAGRSSMAERVPAQFWCIAIGGALFMLTAAGVVASPVFIVIGNFAIGASMGWNVAAQTTFVLVIDPDRIANATSVMIASVIALGGLGAVVFGAAANSLGVPAAYVLAGATQVIAGLAGLGYGRSHPGALDISRPEQIPAELAEQGDQRG
jgi:predicted MFS family arabinose efflux permease